MVRLLLYVTLACVTLLAIILSWHPAQATAPDTTTYSWGYPGLGHSEMVCQQLTSHSLPKRAGLELQPVRMSSRVVAAHYCQ